MALTVTWLGHATWSIDADGVQIVVDPFLKPHNPNATVSAVDLSAQYILVTHGHGDHTLDLVALAKATNALVICNFEIAEWLGKQGVVNVHSMNHGGAWNFPFGRVKMTIAHHSSVLPDGTYAGNPGGFLINFNDGHDVYIAGDTALTYDMRLIGWCGPGNPADWRQLYDGTGRRHHCRAVCQSQARVAFALQHVSMDHSRCPTIRSAFAARDRHRLHRVGH